MLAILAGGICDFLRGRDWPSEFGLPKWTDIITSKYLMALVQVAVVMPWPVSGMEYAVWLGVYAGLALAYGIGWQTLRAFDGNDLPDGKHALQGVTKWLWNKISSNTVTYNTPATYTKHWVVFFNDGTSNYHAFTETRRKFGALALSVHGLLFYLAFLPLVVYSPFAPIIGLTVFLYGGVAYVCGLLTSRYGEHLFTFIRGAMFSACLYLSLGVTYA